MGGSLSGGSGGLPGESPWRMNVTWPELPRRGNSIYKSLEVRKRNESVMDLGCLGGAVSAELPGTSGLSTERNAVIVRSPAMQDQAWFTKERRHGTIWEVEGAFPRSLWSAFCLLSDCVTPIDLGPRALSVFMNEVRIREFLSVPQFHGSLKLFLKLRKKNQATTENRFQSLLGCKMGTETEPGIEKEFKETFEKRHL